MISQLTEPVRAANSFAQLLGVTRQTVSRWAREGRIAARAIQSGPRVIYRIRYSAFMEFVRRYVRDGA